MENISLWESEYKCLTILICEINLPFYLPVNKDGLKSLSRIIFLLYVWKRGTISGVRNNTNHFAIPYKNASKIKFTCEFV